jgi:hypothetical protein
MQRGLVSLFILVMASLRVEAGCIDPATLAHSTASITRYFDDKEKEARPGVLGISGTGWFLSPNSMVTVEHVVAAMRLSDQNWKEIEIRKEENKQSIPARIRHLAGSYAEKIALLELRIAVSDAQAFQLRMEPLVPEEPVLSVAYPGDGLRAAGGSNLFTTTMQFMSRTVRISTAWGQSQCRFSAYSGAEGFLLRRMTAQSCSTRAAISGISRTR